MQCKQAHEYAHIKCKQTRFMSLLPLLVCFSCSRILIHLFLQCCSLFVRVHVHVQTTKFPYFISFVQISPPLSSISIKGMWYQLKSLDTNWKSVQLIVTKDCTWGRWLRLNLCIFDGHNHMCWNGIICIALEIPHRIFDLDIFWWGASPYVIAWVIHLSILLVRELSLLDDHLKLRDFLLNHLHVW